ncbi:30S ribosomal protein S4e [Candidatus Bathyarchaeota archaeon]|nr:30S ribosomal protein S4e [Candidatus Bathyarchaeota archaeon]
MGKKGGSTGLKRKPAPRFWPIPRKKFTWIVKPSPGPHSLQESLPLAVVLRAILGFAQTEKEAKKIVSQGKIYVDGKIRRRDDFPVSLMDVIAILDVDKSFRILPSTKGLILLPISKEEASFKLCRIENKTVTKNGHVQLNLNDGSNLLVKVTDAKNPQEDVYTTLDTLKMSLPDKQISEHVKMKENCFGIITGGKNIGKHGKIVEIEKTKAKKRRNAFVTIEDAKGNHYQTILDFVFAIGEAKPLISLPEVA